MSIHSIYTEIERLVPVRTLIELATSGQGHEIGMVDATGSIPAFVVAAIAGSPEPGGPVVCLSPEHDAAAYLAADVTSVLEATEKGGSADVLLVPPSGLRPYDQEQSAALGRVQERMDAILAIEAGFRGVVISSPEGVAERIPPPRLLEEAAPVVRSGDRIRPEELLERLVDKGFVVREYVEEPGELASRGGIVDVYPFAGQYPVRIEFFGDEIDSIREFDSGSQRSISHVEAARLVPDPGELPDDAEFGTLFDYLPKQAPLVLFDPERIRFGLEQVFVTASEAYSQLAEGRFGDGKAAPRPAARFVSPSELQTQIGAHQTVISVGGEGDERIDVGSKPPPVFNKSVGLLRARIAENTRAGWSTHILCDGRGQLDRLNDLLGERKEGFEYTLVLKTLHQGFELPAARLAVYTDHEIFNRYHRPSSRKRLPGTPRLSLGQLTALSPGDFVVHVDHGIGRFAGLERVKVRGRTQEAVRVLYEGDDLLYVNINSLGRLHKYSAREGHAPKLTRLGSGQWERVKSRAKKRVKDIARGLIKLYAERKSAAGFAFSDDSVWQRELEASFQYEDTPDQYQASEDVKGDMQQNVPMDRLVCGDVGFGKTEVAVRAAFKAVENGKQVAVLVPTTILAAQHHKTFSDRLTPYPVSVDVLSRFRSPKEQKVVVSQIAAGKTDVVIGTQRIVSKDVKFKDLGLLIIDEEQRFGVAVKEKIRALRSEVDTLTLTATPIPRTLQFSLMGARDLSLINTPPPNRQPIVTEVHTFEKRIVRDAILYEVNRGGQVFFVHNRVRTIDQMAASLKALVDGVRFGVAHGQMRARDLEKVMLEFLDGKFDVLVCTNIVESGLDVTNANTMIIDRADRFGLADLHQLRGRVGRSDRKAFCYLLVPSIHTLTREARQRLKAIEEFSDLGSGFNIAMRDLDIRGAGNLLGAEQSGFIDEIGFETYHKILDEAVSELRNEEFTDLFGERGDGVPATESTVDLDLDALIPASYVGLSQHRLDLYRRIAEAKSVEDFVAINGEMTDRFGEVPQTVKNLVVTAEIRLFAERLRLPRVQFKRNRLFLTVPGQKDDVFYPDMFAALLQRLNELEHKYVIKDMAGKTRLIVQEVADQEVVLQIMKRLQEPVAAPDEVS